MSAALLSSTLKIYIILCDYFAGSFNDQGKFENTTVHHCKTKGIKIKRLMRVLLVNVL